MGMELTIGTKVHYTAPHGEKQNGVIKSHSDDLTTVFVVFNCANDWENYQDYTGQSTKILALNPGWV